MRKIIVLLIIFAFFFSVNNALAKFPDQLPGPEIMPDSPFYFLKTWYEKIVLFFTFDLVKKAERYKTFAEKRVYEAKEMIKQGKEEATEKIKEVYKSHLNKAKEKLEKAIQKAIIKKKEQLRTLLEIKLEEIKNKILEAVNL